MGAAESLKRGLYLFTNDLRVQDNPTLWQASQTVDRLHCVSIVDPALSRGNRYGLKSCGPLRQQFLAESRLDLHHQLLALDQQLVELHGEPLSCLQNEINKHQISHVFRSRQPGWYENRLWQTLRSNNPTIEFIEVDSGTLFDTDSLPMDIAELPNTFSQFRRTIEKQSKLYEQELASLRVERLPPKLGHSQIAVNDENDRSNRFIGGTQAAHRQIESYFSSDAPTNYKVVRNALDGWSNSCKFSPWLAHGCLSVRALLRRLQRYEQEQAKNESTYWIFFELLWREYFQWYAHKHGLALYRFAGIRSRSPLTAFYPERFKKWINANTPYPLVNACMRELATTGYLSNRGRQIVASCLVNELAIDWRYGAAYFEEVLLDYDVAVNWGNWQYIAGVGADPRGGRHFNLDKQSQRFDPQGVYQNKWSLAAESDTANSLCPPLDSVDAADWPLI